MQAALSVAAAVLALCLLGYAVRGRRPGRPVVLLSAAGLLLCAAALAITASLHRDPPGSWQEAWDARSTDVLRAWFEANTGPTVPLTETTTGIYTVDSKSAADDLVGRTVVGRILVTASGVTLRDFKAVGDGGAGSVIEISGGLTGVVLQDFEVDGQDHLTTTACLSGGTWANVIVRRADIHDCLDGVRIFEGSSYEHLYVHDSTAHPLPYGGEEQYHADAVQIVRGGEPILIHRSFLDHGVNGPNTTGVVMLKTDTASVDGVIIEHNYLNGASYTITVGASEHGAPTNIAVRHNRFGRDYERGLWSGAGVDDGADYDRRGNVFADTFEPVPLQWGRL